MTGPFQNSYSQLPAEAFEKVQPTPVKDPKIISYNQALADHLGINLNLAELSGNHIPENSQPLSMVYSGHQFGGFSPRLGDGRAILLGEVKGYDIQLKGAGRTPYSRRGDGRSALGPVLREYLLSEAMHALGVPTTRALAAVSTGEMVQRETPEPGGIFTRVAKSHLRIGTLQYFAAHHLHEELEIMVNYANDRLYPENKGALDLLKSVIASQAHLIAQWMSIGFIHGVMNTDNMSLSGETIDYGPCAFMDHFNPAQKYSYIDQQGRYAYQNQPGIAQWNLVRLAEALLPLLDENEAQASLNQFPQIYKSARQNLFAKKLGVPDLTDWPLVQELLDLLEETKTDFTQALRLLSDDPEAFTRRFPQAENWHHRWNELSPDHELMKEHNPIYIPRNHLVQEALSEAYQGRLQAFHNLHAVLHKPFSHQNDKDRYSEPPRKEQEIEATFCGT